MLEGNPYSNNPPLTVFPVTQLQDDVFALNEFFSPEDPPKVQDRCSSIEKYDSEESQ
jgi:hypothetical protein